MRERAKPLSKFPTQLGVTHGEAEARPSVNGRGERTVTASLIYRDGDSFSSYATYQLDILAAATLVTELKAAIDAHYVDSITPKPVGEL
jgi:hypothetical protein